MSIEGKVEDLGVGTPATCPPHPSRTFPPNASLIWYPAKHSPGQRGLRCSFAASAKAKSLPQNDAPWHFTQHPTDPGYYCRDGVRQRTSQHGQSQCPQPHLRPGLGIPPEFLSLLHSLCPLGSLWCTLPTVNAYTVTNHSRRFSRFSLGKLRNWDCALRPLTYPVDRTPGVARTGVRAPEVCVW